MSVTSRPATPKAQTLAFRDSVVLYLNEQGVTGARRPRSADLKGSGSPFDRGIILGLPWVINVHRQQTMDLSGTLDAAKDRAAVEGCDRYAVIHHRRAHGVGDAYVVMPLRVFTTAVS